MTKLEKQLLTGLIAEKVEIELGKLSNLPNFDKMVSSQDLAGKITVLGVLNAMTGNSEAAAACNYWLKVVS